jgi:hypothetical protein
MSKQKRETKYDAEGNMDEYIKATQKSMVGFRGSVAWKMRGRRHDLCVCA